MTTPSDYGTLLPALDTGVPASPRARQNHFRAEPELAIDASALYHCVLKTAKGDIVIRMFAAEAPVTVNNFIHLSRSGFYDGTMFHRVIADFMAQGGDPTGTGTGGPGYRFKDEFHDSLVFDRPGLLAMANAGPRTNGSQFFITFVPCNWLDHKHTIFGEIVAGMDVVNSISIRDPQRSRVPGDLINSVEVFEQQADA